MLGGCEEVSPGFAFELLAVRTGAKKQLLLLFPTFFDNVINSNLIRHFLGAVLYPRIISTLLNYTKAIKIVHS